MPIPKPERPYIEEVKRDPGTLRIAMSVGGWGREKEAHPEAIARTRLVAEFLQSLGQRVEEVRDEDICDWEVMWGSAGLGWHALPKRWKDISVATGVPISQENLEPTLYWAYQAAQKYTEFDVWHMQEVNAIITRRFGQFFEKYDLLLCPATAVAYIKAGPGSGFSTLEKLENGEQAFAWLETLIDESRYFMLANETGTPAIAVPAGLGETKLPLGVQLYAPWCREDRLLQMAAQLERARPEWFNQIPPVHVSKV
jgi:amidase